MWRVKLSSKGQIVIPVEVRKALGLDRGSQLVVRLEGGRVVLEPAAPEPPSELFVKVGSERLDRILKEAKASSDKIERLLRDLGAGS